MREIVKANNPEPDEFEKAISGTLPDLEINSNRKAQIRELHITAWRGRSSGRPSRRTRVPRSSPRAPPSSRISRSSSSNDHNV